MNVQTKRFDQPDDVQTFPHGQVNIITIGGWAVARSTFEPGWRWTNDIRPIVGTDLCEEEHLLVVLSGRCVVRMEDGGTSEFGPGDVVAIAPRHDAWVVGNEPLVVVDWVKPEALPDWQDPALAAKA